MKTQEFLPFQRLLSEVHQKAFGEPLSPLPYGKAQALSWLIEEETGHMLSYKTLANYAKAALGKSVEVNPNASTLAILVRYLHGQAPANDVIAWNMYCHAVAC
jgi:hypothetical protein